MATLTTNNIAEAILPVIRQVIREEVPPIVREIVKTELDINLEPRFEAIGQDLQNITLELQRHSQALDEHSRELHRLGVLYEDLDDRFQADSELLRDSLGVERQVRDHEDRLTAVESTQQILKKTVTDHSRQLKAA